MMDKIILPLLILFFSTSIFSQDNNYFLSKYEFREGQIIQMYGDKVKLREAPNTDSNTIDLISIGEQVEIIEKTDDFMPFNGIDSPWYKVKFNSKVGYVLEGLMSYESINNDNVSFLVQIDKKDDIKFFIKVRAVKNDKSYSESSTQLMNNEFSIKSYGSKGVKGIKNILFIDYIAEACGINGGGIYFFYDGNNLTKAIDFTEVADGGLYWFSEKLTFPDEMDGLEGKILYKREVGENKDEATGWVESKITELRLEWKENELFPKIEKEK